MTLGRFIELLHSRRLGISTRRRRGISLVSTVIGITLATVLLVTNAASLMYSARTARVISYRLAARNVVQGVLEFMMASAYSDITQSDVDAWLAANPDILVLDSLNGMTCEMDVEVVDEFTVTSATGTSLTASTASWETNEWTGNTVFITAGKGQGQRASITSNTSNTLVTSLLGFSQTSWISTPIAGSRFLINGGKTARITASFDFRGVTYTETVEGLVVRDD
jgi:hypothetical protein